MSIAALALQMTGLFEAELLIELMLRYWNHPYADDENFRQQLLESAAQVLEASVRGERLFDELAPQNVNVVAAVCFSETTSIVAEPTADSSAREAWVDQVKRSIPSCFCDPDLLT
jgi:hypothetical protein